MNLKARLFLGLMLSGFVSSAAIADPKNCQPDLARSETCGKRVVEVVFVLDTTGSMSGLIAGAKSKIWSIANEIADNDADAIVRMGLVGFRDIGDAYVTRVHALTEDLDDLYGDLIAFQADGGGDRPESVNQALDEAITMTGWTRGGERNIRLVFLAGDSPPHMDYDNDVHYAETLKKARAEEITVHTLQAGRHADTEIVWKEIARLGGGVFAQIPQSGNVQVITTPFDDDIQRIQRDLDGTVIPYGTEDTRNRIEANMTIRMDAKSSSAADRAAYRMKKSGKKEVVTGGADLVAEITSGNVSLDGLDVDKLPEEIGKLQPEKRRELIEQNIAKRRDLDEKLKALSLQREGYLARNAPKDSETDSFDAVVRNGIKSAF